MAEYGGSFSSANGPLKDRELAPWLDAKFGSVDNLWHGSRNLCSLLTKDMLGKIPSSFVDLQTNTKLRLLMSLLYLPKRNVELWIDEIDDILSLACQDTDEWVQTLAELLKEFPTTGAISLNPDSGSTQFTKTLQEMRKIINRRLKGNASSLLPLDVACMNKQAALATWGVQIPQASSASARYFSLKRKPKAAAQRIEFLQKSADAATQMKHKNGPLSTILPIRHKSTIRNMDDKTPLKGIPSQNPLKNAGNFSSSAKPIVRSTTIPPPNTQRRAGGVKLIDIDETPQALIKKRRTMEAEEKAAKKAAKEEQKRQRETEKAQKKLQRELKTQHLLTQSENRISESSTGGSDAGAPEQPPVNEKPEVSLADSFVQPTPDYAAELFDVAGGRVGTSLNTVVQQSPFVTSQESVFQNFANAFTTAKSGIYNGSATTSAITGNKRQVPPTTPAETSFVWPVNRLELDQTPSSSTAPQEPTTSTSVPEEVAAEAVKPAGRKQRQPRKSKTDDLNEKSQVGEKKKRGAASNSKRRKTAADAQPPVQEELHVPAQQPPKELQAVANITGIHVQGKNFQPQQQQLVRIQLGGVVGGQSGTGVALPQSIFVPANVSSLMTAQTRFATVQQPQQQQQKSGQETAPRTAVLLVQPGGSLTVSNATISPGVNFYAATPIVGSSAAGTPRLIIPQQQQANLANFASTGSSTMNTVVLTTSQNPTIQTRPQVTNLILPNMPGPSDNPDVKKQTFSITKDVMLKAQEMFRTANKLTRPEKALILGFMAGNRENPCPQMGQTLTVRLSENQDVQVQADGTTKPVMVESYFQMNFETGEWKQLRKIRLLCEGEGQA